VILKTIPGVLLVQDLAISKQFSRGFSMSRSSKWKTRAGLSALVLVAPDWGPGHMPRN
jgi:hypothetical protein